MVCRPTAAQLLTERTSRAARDQVTNKLAGIKVCSFFLSQQQNSLNSGQFGKLNYQNASPYAYTNYSSMCSKCLRTLQYTDRQRAFVIYGAIIYSKHRYENGDMTFAQTQISFMRSLSTTKIFFRPLSCIRTLDRNSTIYSIFGTTSRGP